MTSDGKQLESLVSFVEKTLVPQGFAVDTNTKVFNDDGVQMAEFDVEVKGKVGTTDLCWLIECRDRPSQGAAPGSWIEQLVGRRSRFGFNKVTAVSTTGFAPGVKDFAELQGIELREVKELSPESFSDWLIMRDCTMITRKAILHHARILIHEDETQERKEEMVRVISNVNSTDPILRSQKTEKAIPVLNAFLGAVNQVGNLFDDIEPNDPPKKIKIHIKYENDESHFVIATELGDIRIVSIICNGELVIEEKILPLITTAEYRKEKDGAIISQVAGFESHEIMGHELSLEMHKLAETGETHVCLRKIK